MPELADLLARFIIGGTVVVLASEWLTPHSTLARRFFVSPLWPVVRYAAGIAAVVLCAIVLQRNGS